VPIEIWDRRTDTNTKQHEVNGDVSRSVHELRSVFWLIKIPIKNRTATTMEITTTGIYRVVRAVTFSEQKRIVLARPSCDDNCRRRSAGGLLRGVLKISHAPTGNRQC